MPYDADTAFKSNRRQRRAAARAARRAPKLANAPENRRDFSAGVHTFLCENLEQFGNVLNQEHRAALMALCGCLTNLASGVTSGRYAFALPTGAGKTSAVIAWLTSLHWANADRNSGVKAPWSVVVCASTRAIQQRRVTRAQRRAQINKLISEIVDAERSTRRGLALNKTRREQMLARDTVQFLFSLSPSS